MSAFLLSKLHIDVLVTLAVSGPAEAGGTGSAWRPEHRFLGVSWPESVDELGELLLRTNAEAVLDPEWDDEEPPPTYVFERFPYPVTAIEGLKSISCYIYQTADDRERSEGSAPDAVCRWLQGRLISHLPGYDQAPWGWEIPDLDAKAERTRVADLVQHPLERAPADDDVARAIELLVAHGIELAPHTDVDNDLPAGVYVPIDRGFQAQPSRKVGHWSSVNLLNQGQVHVRAYADDAAARVGYLLRRAVHEHVTEGGLIEWTRQVVRHGRLVVDLARHPSAPMSSGARPGQTYTPLQQQKDALAMLGHPDESWSTEDLPIIADVAGGPVVCQGVALPGGSAAGGIRVANDGDGLQRLAMLVDDESDRQRVLTIDPDTHTTLMIYGVVRADQVTRVRMQELATPPGSDPNYLLDITVDGLRRTPAIVVVIDKLPHLPTEAVIRHGGTGASLTACVIYR